jgi:hypothetical protein
MQNISAQPSFLKLCFMYTDYLQYLTYSNKGKIINMLINNFSHNIEIYTLIKTSRESLKFGCKRNEVE